MSQELEYNKPWILQRADPYVYKHIDGTYYFTASIPAYDRIVLRHSDTLAGLKDAEEVRVWQKHDKGIMSEHIWAPELHYLNGKWYIYYAGGDIDDVWAIRPYILECADQDPHDQTTANIMTGEAECSVCQYRSKQHIPINIKVNNVAILEERWISLSKYLFLQYRIVVETKKGLLYTKNKIYDRGNLSEVILQKKRK